MRLGRNPEYDLAAVDAARRGAGEGNDVIVDGSHRYSLDRAVWMGRELAERGVFWFEEPFPPEELDLYVRLRPQIDVPLAAGENDFGVQGFRETIRAGALDVVQPDAVLAVGMLRSRTVAEYALLRHRWFTPHTWTNGLGLLANLHLAAGVGGGPYLEFPWDPPGWTVARRDFFLAEPVTIDAGGRVSVPAGPGLGAVIDEAAVRCWTVS
jgi:L-alanine-DL-glutamate epimerase-like enolase superfamily enzyme